MRYFVIAADGNQYGPADIPTLKQWVTENRIQPGSQLKEESTGTLVLANSVPGLFPIAAAAPPQILGSPNAGASYGGAAYTGGSQPPRPAAKQKPLYSDGDNSDFVRCLIYSAITIFLALTIHRAGLFLGAFALYRGIKCQVDGHQNGILAIAVSAVAFVVVFGLFFFNLSHSPTFN